MEDKSSLHDLPQEVIISALNEQFPCRQRQIFQLAYLLSPAYPAVSSIVIHGLTATGKSAITRQLLSQLQTLHVIVESRECITGRHLLEGTLATCIKAVEEQDDIEIDRRRYARCESLSALQVHLARLLQNRPKFILVFDGIDGQREAPPLHLAALARLGDYIANLSILFIVSQPHPADFHRAGIPYIAFPAFSRDESIHIISRTPLPIFPTNDQSQESGNPDSPSEDDTWLWTRFCATVWDSQAKYVGRDIISFRQIAGKLWPAFVAPIIDGTYKPRDFSKLMVAKRALFQSEDMLAERVVPRVVQEPEVTAATPRPPHDLRYYPTFLLLAAYLASYNPPRTDAIYFMKSTSTKKTRRNGGGGTMRGRKPTHRKIPRRLLAPSPFTLERMLAIFKAIVPHDVKGSVDLYTQFATLTSLRLVQRAGVSGDVLEAGAKWRVNVGWEYIGRLGRGVGCEVADYVFEG